jgi:hypothetical protein
MLKTALKPAAEVFDFPVFRKASEVLDAARKVIRNKRRWITGNYAVDVNNESVGCQKKDKDRSYAVAFCAMGAVRFVNGPAEKSASQFLAMAAAIESKNAVLKGKELVYADGTESYYPEEDDVTGFNDANSHKDALKMFARAIRMAKAAGK